MARLLGKADATLIQAATKAAMAGVPADMTRIYENFSRSYERATRRMGQSFKEAVGKAADAGVKLSEKARENKNNIENVETYENNLNFQTKPSNLEKEISGPKIGDDGQTKFPDLSDISLERSKPTLTEKKEFGEVTKEFKDEVAKTYSITNVNGNEDVLTTKTISEQLNDIRKEKISLGILGKDRKKFTKEEKKKRKKELDILESNLRASALQFKTFENTATALIESDNFNSEATGELNQNFLRALLSKGEPLEDGSRAIMGFDEKGKMGFVYIDKYGDPIMGRDGKKLTKRQDNIDKLLVPASAAREVYGAHGPLQRKLGLAGYPYDRTVSDSNIEAQVRTKNDALDILYYQGIGMEQSIAEALHGVKTGKDGTISLEPSLLGAKVFAELNTENWDNSGDGTVDQQDFATPKNYEKLVNYILSGDDLKLTKQVIKNYAADQEQIKHQQGLNKYNQAQAVVANQKTPALNNSTSIRDNIVTAWKSGDINGLKLPYGRSIVYDEEDKSYVIKKIDGTELTRFKTPDNEILQQILSAHKVQEKDLAEIDFTKPMFGTEVGKVTKFGGRWINRKGKEVMQNQVLPKSR